MDSLIIISIRVTIFKILILWSRIVLFRKIGGGTRRERKQRERQWGGNDRQQVRDIETENYMSKREHRLSRKEKAKSEFHHKEKERNYMSGWDDAANSQNGNVSTFIKF